MDYLSSMDAAFLHFETPETPMHVGTLELLDLPQDCQGVFHEDAKAYLGARMHLLPAFGRKLVNMPFDLADYVVEEHHKLRQSILAKGVPASALVDAALAKKPRAAAAGRS